MSIVLRTRNLLPSLVNDFFNRESMFPSALDFNGDLLDFDGKTFMPEANIIENEKNYLIELAAPGLERKDFKVETDNKTLTISAEKKEEKKEEKKNYKCREFSYNSFSRSFTIPENSLPEKIDAKYENGVLHLTLPKKEVTVSKAKTEIKVG